MAYVLCFPFFLFLIQQDKKLCFKIRVLEKCSPGIKCQVYYKIYPMFSCFCYHDIRDGNNSDEDYSDSQSLSDEYIGKALKI